MMDGLSPKSRVLCVIVVLYGGPEYSSIEYHGTMNPIRVKWLLYLRDAGTRSAISYNSVVCSKHFAGEKGPGDVPCLIDGESVREKLSAINYCLK